jgi:hypothetical protein
MSPKLARLQMAVNCKVTRIRTHHAVQPWRWKQYVPPKRWYTTTILHGAETQKTTNFIFTAVITSNLTNRIFLVGRKISLKTSVITVSEPKFEPGPSEIQSRRSFNKMTTTSRFGPNITYIIIRNESRSTVRETKRFSVCDQSGTELTPCPTWEVNSRSAIVTKFHAFFFYETWRFIAVFTRSRHWPSPHLPNMFP